MNDFIVTINNKKHLVQTYPDGKIKIGAKTIKAETTQIDSNLFLLKYDHKIFEVTINKIDKDKSEILIEGNYFESVVRTVLQEKSNELRQDKNKFKHHSEIASPMPGLILKMLKSVGDEVTIGEPLLILEAMKMENELRSPSLGKVKEVYFKVGQSVEKGSIILTIE